MNSEAATSNLAERMRANVDARELAKIPYLRAEVVGDRQAALTSLWDGTEWHAWIPGPSGTLVHMRPRELAEGTYVAKAPARADDIHLPFAEFFWKRASWPAVGHWYNAILEDLHQLAAAVAKIDFFWAMREHAQGGGLGIRRFVGSELEYLLTVCRSVFDELQEVVRAIWSKVRLVDEELQRRKGTLPPSFRKMVMSDGNLMQADEIGRRHNVPPPLAAAYQSAGSFLKVLRELRDGIIHHGRDAPIVLTGERGFILGKGEPGFASLPIWKPEHSFNEHAVSLRPAVAYLVATTLYTCNTFADVLGQIFAFPPDVAPDHHLFVRSVHGGALLAVQEVLRGGSPWWTAGAENLGC
jgi:hypothetical protein